MSSAHPIRVLIVDDAATIRSALKIMIRREKDMEVVGTAANGLDAVRMVAETQPDIVLMDIEMPVMDGIEATEAIMDTNPVPVLIFSSVAEEAAPRTLEALGRGAVDFITKDGTSTAVDIGNLREKLLAKIREFGRRRGSSGTGRNPSQTIIRNRQRESEYRLKRGDTEAITPESLAAGSSRMRPTPEEIGKPMVVRPMSASLRLGGAKTMRLVKRASPKGAVRLVCIGASTGGPQAVQALVSSIPGSIAVPVVIVQHMPASFIGSFAKRLANATRAEVKVAEGGEVLQPGTIYVSPGGVHARIVQRGGLLIFEITSADVPGVLNKPSVDVLLASAAEAVRGECVVVILTGMGRDGAQGAKVLHDLGATVMAQDEASSVVYGMPRAVVEDGCADIVLPIEELGDTLMDLVWKGSRKGAGA